MFNAPANIRYYNDKLITLCGVLLPEDSTLAAEVRLAVEQPDAYFARFGQRLEDRGITEPIRILPWIALLDGLMERNKLVELDWRMEPIHVMAYLDRLLPDEVRTAHRWDWVEVAYWHTQASTGDFLNAIGARLSVQGFVLACFFLQTDSYPLTLVEEDRFEKARRLAQETRYGDLTPCRPGSDL